MTYSIETVLRSIPGVSCLEGDGTNLFVGTQDGELLHYVIHKDDPESDSVEHTYLLASRQDAPGRKPPQAIILLASVQLAAVCANEQLSFYTLPEFAPASDLRVVKDVQGVIQNATLADRIEADGSAAFTVYTKRKIRQIKVSRQIVKLTKEVEYAGCIAACQRGSIVCVATKSSYDLLDLDQKAKIPLFPVVQGESEPVGSTFDAFIPRITSVTPDEFLLASGSPESSTTMGIFVTLEGEITRGTLMYNAYPLRMVSSYPHIITLLSDGTIQVHDVENQQLLQTIQIEDVTDLIHTSQPISVVSSKHLDLMLICKNAVDVKDHSPEKSSSRGLNIARGHADILTTLLLRQTLGISAMITDTRLSSIDQKLDDGDLQAALSDAHQLARDTPPSYAERLFHELGYIHSKAGLLYLKRMLFDDAVDNLKKGNIDPRILVSYFPEYGVDATQVEVYKGLVPIIKSITSIDTIIHSELSQTVDDDATLLELTTIVKSNAVELLRRYLTQFRERKDYASTSNDLESRRLFSMVDVTLLRILLQSDTVEAESKIKAFLPHSINHAKEVCEVLAEHNQWCYLAEFHELLFNHAEAMHLWRELENGALSDGRYAGDGVQRIHAHLAQFCSESLFWDFGLWLLEKEPDIGLALLSHVLDENLLSLQAKDLLQKIKRDNQKPNTYRIVLEYFVMKRRIVDSSLATELLILHTTDVLQNLEARNIEDSLGESIDDYRALRPPKIPYLAFVSEHITLKADESIQHFANLRADLIDMLQGIVEYDAQAILNLILQKRRHLLAERILLYGRLSKHGESINLMVHDLQDFDSAEVYCYHGGISLSQIRISSDKAETVAMRKKLFPLLFAEYLNLQDFTLQFTQGSQLLNRWGNYIDIAEVLSIIPDHWSVEMISGFLLSALSKLAGDKRDAQIKRSLARITLHRQTEKQFVLIDH